MERLAHNLIRFRWLVLAGWIAVVAVAFIASAGLTSLLSNRFDLPGAESEKAAKILKDHFGQQPEGSFTLVVEGPPGSAQSLVAPTRQAGLRAAKALKTGQLVDVRPVSHDVVTASIVSQLQPADAKGYTDRMRDAAGEVRGAQVYLTGQSAILVFGALH